jgi:selenocysteine lyase/cysteine desulfurase
VARGARAVRALGRRRPHERDAHRLHPRPVREAIERHRRALDADPVTYLNGQNVEHQERVLRAAAEYLGGEPDGVAFTDSTTMGLGLVYNRLPLRTGDEILTAENDYYATHAALRLAAEKSGAAIRHAELYESATEASAEGIVEALARGLSERTRVVALTWVSSWSGLKLSSGIVCFDVEGMEADAVVGRLRERRIIATVTPYAVRHARLAPSIRNTEGEVDVVLEEIERLA